MGLTKYRPETDGFAFINSWQIEPAHKTEILQVFSSALYAVEAALLLTGPAGWIVDIAIEVFRKDIMDYLSTQVSDFTYGMCGGMAFASLDYWHKGWVAPCGNDVNDQPLATTPSAPGTILRNYLWSRLLTSLEDNGERFVQYALMGSGLLPMGPEMLKDITRNELSTLKRSIDQGIPVTVGLIGTTSNPFNNHQVLCYGYADNANGTCTLMLYDNNNPGVTSKTTLDFSGSVLNAAEDCPSAARGSLRGFFCTQYVPVEPPRSVVLHSGLTASPQGVGIGQPAQVNCSAWNAGFHKSHRLKLVVLDSFGQRIEGADDAIDEGKESKKLSKPISFTLPGYHRLKVIAELTAADGTTFTKTLPPGGSAQTPDASVVVFADRRITSKKKERCTVENAAGSETIYQVEAADMGAGLKFQWTVGGAAIDGDATSSAVSVKLPNDEGVSVTVSVRVTRPDGGYSSGSISFNTVSQDSANFAHILCRLRGLIATRPWYFDPAGPVERVVKPGEIEEFNKVANMMYKVGRAASQAKAPIVLSGVIRGKARKRK